MLSNRKEQEAELKELRQNRELLTQWERQIADIIQWVTEEKDARCTIVIVMLSCSTLNRSVYTSLLVALLFLCVSNFLEPTSRVWPKN